MKKQIFKLLLTATLTLPAALAFADGVVIATDEDVSSFDRMLEKSKRSQSGETASARNQRLQDRVRSAVEREKQAVRVEKEKNGKDAKSAAAGKDNAAAIAAPAAVDHITGSGGGQGRGFEDRAKRSGGEKGGKEKGGKDK